MLKAKKIVDGYHYYHVFYDNQDLYMRIADIDDYSDLIKEIEENKFGELFLDEYKQKEYFSLESTSIFVTKYTFDNV